MHNALHNNCNNTVLMFYFFVILSKLQFSMRTKWYIPQIAVNVH